MKMWSLAVCVPALLLAGCGESTGPEAVVPAELVGEWTAEPACAPPCAFTLTWVANPQASLDAVAVLGVTVRVRITSAGGFSRSGSGDPAEGSVRVEGPLMMVRDERAVVDTIGWEVRGQELHLAFRRKFAQIDFDGDGVADPARVTGVFRRR